MPIEVNLIISTRHHYMESFSVAKSKYSLNFYTFMEKMRERKKGQKMVIGQLFPSSQTLFKVKEKRKKKGDI